MEDLDSAIIRHLILESRIPSGQIGDIVRSVCSRALQRGLLQTMPQIEYQNPLSDKITAVIWELIIEGIYTPGLGMQQPNLPFLRATEYGRQCFEAGELTPHDPDDYLRRLRAVCPSIDDITLLYAGEALDTFRAGNNLACAVMIGVSAEKMLLRLGEAVQAALNSPQRQSKFANATKNLKANTLHNEILARLRSPATPLPVEIESVLIQHIDGIYDLIRRTRNDAGHPTGKRMQRSETQALLLLFPTYCKTVHDLVNWLAVNPI